jgi:hypothetical protein
MKKLGRVLSLTIGLGVAVALVGHFNSGTTRAVVIDPVKVVNSASDPVPVTGNVKASQSGSWKVAIDGTPTVNVASAPPVNVSFPSSIGINGTVPVRNAPGLIGFDPFIVQDFENPARTSFQAQCNWTAGVGCRLTVVPSTRILVIEMVTAEIGVSTGGKPFDVEVIVAPPVVPYSLTPAFAGSIDGFSSEVNSFVQDLYTVTAPVKIYAGPGTDVTAASLATGNNPVATFAISGHYVCAHYQQLC